MFATETVAAESASDWLWRTLEGDTHREPTSSVAWHGRLMVIAWGILIPLGVLVARFYKVTARQNWPTTLDNQYWWIVHRLLQYAGVIATIVAVALVVRGGLPNSGIAHRLHAIGGWLLLGLGISQVLGAWLRGSKGGPVDVNAWPNSPVVPGDHYNMTRRRVVFETIHIALGYTSLAIALVTATFGLVIAGAPRWMWLLLYAWWIGLSLRFIQLERTNAYIRTYPAIWGPSTVHPGNRTERGGVTAKCGRVGDRSNDRAA